MREFILRAQKAKTSEFSINDLPKEGRMDLVCRCISNALFISNDIRQDTIIHVVFEGPTNPPKSISFVGKDIKNFGFDEKTIAKHILNALKKGKNLKMNESVNASEGIIISKKSFEGLIKEKSQTHELYYLHKKGDKIEDTKFSENVCFIFGDYIGIPKKTDKFIDRYAKKISISPLMLFASHCIVITHNALDHKI